MPQNSAAAQPSAQDWRFLFLQTKNTFISKQYVDFFFFSLFRSTRACSTRSYGPVSPTVCLWMKNCSLSWWRRRVMPLIWWENGTWACTKKTACLHGGVLTHTLVKKKWIEKGLVIQFLTLHTWTGNWTNLHFLLRLPDRQWGLL